jgi:type II secretory pathway pseudopilin PulG
MNLTLNSFKRLRRAKTGALVRSLAFTLPEVVISLAIASISVGSIMYGYVISAKRAEWSGYSLNAHTLAMQALERARSARWDPTASPAVDMLTTNNFPRERVLMDMPVTGTNAIYATNYITIATISSSPPVKMIRVDCVWHFMNGRLYTNTVASYRTPGT